MNTTKYTGTYTPSRFATLSHRGKFAIDDMTTVIVEDGGQHPEIGSTAWLQTYAEEKEIRGKVTSWEGHTNGNVTVTVELPVAE